MASPWPPQRPKPSADIRQTSSAGAARQSRAISRSLARFVCLLSPAVVASLLLFAWHVHRQQVEKEEELGDSDSRLIIMGRRSRSEQVAGQGGFFNSKAKKNGVTTQGGHELEGGHKASTGVHGMSNEAKMKGRQGGHETEGGHDVSSRRNDTRAGIVEKKLRFAFNESMAILDSDFYDSNVTVTISGCSRPLSPKEGHCPAAAEGANGDGDRANEGLAHDSEAAMSGVAPFHRKWSVYQHLQQSKKEGAHLLSSLEEVTAREGSAMAPCLRRVSESSDVNFSRVPPELQCPHTTSVSFSEMSRRGDPSSADESQHEQHGSSVSNTSPKEERTPSTFFFDAQQQEEAQHHSTHYSLHLPCGLLVPSNVSFSATLLPPKFSARSVAKGNLSAGQKSRWKGQRFFVALVPQQTVPPVCPRKIFYMEVRLAGSGNSSKTAGDDASSRGETQEGGEEKAMLMAAADHGGGVWENWLFCQEGQKTLKLPNADLFVLLVGGDSCNFSSSNVQLLSSSSSNNPFSLSLVMRRKHIDVLLWGARIISFQYRNGFLPSGGQPSSGIDVIIGGDISVAEIKAQSLPLFMDPAASLERKDPYGLRAFFDDPQLPVERLRQPEGQRASRGEEEEEGEVGVVMVGVLSSAANYDLRMAARKTWMQSVLVRSRRVFVRFVVGMDRVLATNRQTHQEQLNFGDLEILPMLEGYRLILAKTLAVCRLAVDSGASFLLKIDDDTFIRVPPILETLKRAIANASHENSTHFKAALKGRLPVLMADLEHSFRPQTLGRWKVKEEEWPKGHLNYTWPHGPAYFLSSSLAESIVANFNWGFLPFKSLEDVTMGGWVHWIQCCLKREVIFIGSKKMMNLGCNSAYISAHYQQPWSMLCMWKVLMLNATGICCSENKFKDL